MSWGKICDTLWMHPKVVAAGNEALGAWTRMLSYTSGQLTDGYISEPIARTITRPAIIAKLVSVGLLEPASGGWLIHDYHAYNPTRSDVLTAREKTAARVAASRENKRVRVVGNGVTQPVTNGVTNGVSTPVGTRAPTRPDPSPENKHTPRAREGASVRETPGDADTLVDTLSRASKGAVSSVATLEHQQALACTLADLGVVGAAEVERFGAALADGGMKRYAPWMKVDRVTCAYLLRDGARTLTELVDRWRDPTPATSPSVDLSDPWEAAKARYEAEERERLAKAREARKAAGGAS